MIAPVMSLAQLRAMSNKEPRYKTLAITAAKNFGYDPGDSFCEAMMNLNDVAGETSEDEVVEEVNALRSEV